MNSHRQFPSGSPQSSEHTTPFIAASCPRSWYGGSGLGGLVPPGVVTDLPDGCAAQHRHMAQSTTLYDVHNQPAFAIYGTASESTYERFATPHPRDRRGGGSTLLRARWGRYRRVAAPRYPTFVRPRRARWQHADATAGAAKFPHTAKTYRRKLTEVVVPLASRSSTRRKSSSCI